MKKTVEIKIKGEEKKVTLQNIPAREALALRKRCKDGKDIDEVKFYEELLEHVVVTPKLTIDDFDYDIGSLEELMTEVIKFVYGKNTVGKQE